MKALTAPLTELGSFQQILEGIAKGNTPVFATGVTFLRSKIFSIFNSL